MRAAVEWYDEQQDDLGQEFVNELDASITRCADFPELHELVERPGVRRALLSRFPFAVFYHLEDDDLVILAVVHTARDPAFWRSRVVP